MNANLLAVNVGSSSLKLVLLDQADAVVASQSTDGGDLDLESEIAEFIAGTGSVDLIGHRIVDGGNELTGPVDLTDRTVRDIVAGLADVAPLHNPAALRGIDATDRLLPGVRSFACFDTSFHRTIPDVARTFALPWDWNERWDLRRMGFHGLSHEYCARRSAEILPDIPGGLRLITAHLGAGCSLAAIHDGVSVDTTMGFTPMDGLVMATRPGSLDPGLLLWVMREGAISPEQASDMLENRAGMLGLSGLSSDIRDLFVAAGDGHARARLAIEVFVHRLSGAIASMAASLGGVDAVAFTGGIGENSDEIRSSTCKRLAFLGLELDDESPSPAMPDQLISAPGSAVRALRVTSREDLEMARQIRNMINPSAE